MRRLTICILEGELPKSVKVVAGISSDWDEKPDSLGLNLAVDFEYLRSHLEQQYCYIIPRVAVGKGKFVILTDEMIDQLWEKQRLKLWSRSDRR